MVIATGVLFAAAIPVEAQSPAFVTVHLDTSALVEHPAGPFALDFQLNGGSGEDDANNTVTLFAFAFGGGRSSTAAPVVVGGASGHLGSAVTISDRVFLNTLTQGFVAGSELSFVLLRTASVDPGGTPDQFSVAILDRTGAEVPTQSGSEALIVLDLNSPNPAVQAFASDPTRTPRGGGRPITMSTAQIDVARAVAIDIKPGEGPNSINPTSSVNIPVAILSSPDFDAPSRIEPTSLTFGRTGHEPSLLRPPKSEDVNGDGRLDLICHFDTQIAGFASGNTVGILKARNVDGDDVQGWDSIRIVPNR